jgi:hypothetical protein
MAQVARKLDLNLALPDLVDGVLEGSDLQRFVENVVGSFTGILMGAETDEIVAWLLRDPDTARWSSLPRKQKLTMVEEAVILAALPGVEITFHRPILEAIAQQEKSRLLATGAAIPETLWEFGKYNLAAIITVLRVAFVAAPELRPFAVFALPFLRTKSADRAINLTAMLWWLLHRVWELPVWDWMVDALDSESAKIEELSQAFWGSMEMPVTALPGTFPAPTPQLFEFPEAESGPPPRGESLVPFAIGVVAGASIFALFMKKC